MLSECHDINRIIYDKLVSRKKCIMIKLTLWSKRLDEVMIIDEFLLHFVNITRVTNCTKYRDFQFQLLNNLLPTNIDLKRWKIKNMEQCTFCNFNRETKYYTSFCRMSNSTGNLGRIG